jgi:nucleolar protein 53
MTLDEILQDDGEPDPEQDVVVPKKPSAPKTKQQRTKALRLRAEVSHSFVPYCHC